jgi:hypothetical protein
MNNALKTTLLGLAGAVIAQSAFAADLPSRAPPPVLAPAPFFLFSDTTVSYRIETSATDPGSSAHFIKNIANLSHVDAYAYGTNFFSIDFLQSTGLDPAAPLVQCPTATTGGCTGHYLNGEGSLELYALYRGTLSGNALTHSKAFSLGPLKDISLSFGGDGESQNTAFAPNKRDIVGGLQVAFNVPGYLTVSVHAYKEWNHNGLAECLPGGGSGYNAFCLPSNPDYNNGTGEVSFRVTPEFELGYNQPLDFTGLPLTISGFANFVMPKGKDGFGNNTHTEILNSNRLTLDLGKVAFNKPHLVDAFVGYKYWYDKFGNIANFKNPAYTPGSYESQFFAGVALHIF